MSGASKNGAGRGQHVQKGTVTGKKGSARPNRAGTGPKKAKNGAGRGQRIRKGTVPGKKGSACPKKDGSRQERVGASKLSRDGSKEGRFRARRGRRVQKRGRKRLVHPKRDD